MERKAFCLVSFYFHLRESKLQCSTPCSSGTTQAHLDCLEVTWKSTGISSISLVLSPLPVTAKKAPGTLLGISERPEFALCYMEFLHQIHVGPVPSSVCSARRGLTDSWRDQGSVMAFPQLPGSVLNARPGAILEWNQPDLMFVEGVKFEWWCHQIWIKRQRSWCVTVQFCCQSTWWAEKHSLSILNGCLVI